jgi:hypothetical protein
LGCGFLYFRSGDQRTLTREGVAKLNLTYAFPAGIQCVQVNSNSPSKSQGLVFADPARHEGKRVGYFPDQQTWRKLPTVEGRPELWVGYWNDAKPGPGDVTRSPMLAADMVVRLADGNPWRVPKVRQYDGVSGNWECLLPSLYDYDEKGNLFPSKPLAKHAHLWELTHPIAMAMCVTTDGPTGITDEQVQQCAVALLQANYVVDLPELVAIDALATGDTFASIVMAACRGQELLSWLDSIQKKSNSPVASNGSSSPAGNAA